MSGNSSGLLDSSAGGGEEEKDMKMEETAEGGSGGGNRWPRPETLALLKIRSEMDKAFRDSTLKAPLWEEISRKMMELGYKRSSKKCKEKFENVYKYHKRTKEGRTGKSEGKTYRFFEELEAFETLNSYPIEPELQPAKSLATSTTTTSLIPWISSNNPIPEKVSSPMKQNHHQVSVKPIITNPTFLSKQPSPTMPFPFYSNNNTTTVSYQPPSSNDLTSLNIFSSSTSSSTASDEEEEDHHHQGKRSRKRRKYWKGLFTKLTKEMMEKQEKMQKRFLETLENREKDRISREETWRVQEIARINREHETLVHERSNAVAKDSAIISFLQKISGSQQQLPLQQQNHKSQRRQYQIDHSVTFESKDPKPDTTMKMGNYDPNHSVSPTSSRWPKTEVEALIRIRKNLEANYQENGTKGPLWEEISSGMRRLGYNRSAKRCKEKWENINKYFKKVKETNKKRPLDSKTCPYFHQLEALYNERNKIGASPLQLPLMVTPQRQLLVSQETQIDFEKDKDGSKESDEEGESEEDVYEEEEGEGDNETSEFEIVLNKTSSPMDINNNLFT